MRLAPTLLAFAAALAPCLPAAFTAGVDDQLVRVATDDIGKDPALNRDAKGNPGIGATDLTSKKYLYGNDRESIKASIREGRKGSMPAYEAKLSRAQIKAVSYYLFSVWENAKE